MPDLGTAQLCSASHVHEQCPAPRRNTGTSQSLNSGVESVWYVIKANLLPLKQNLVETACKPWPIFVAHEPIFMGVSALKKQFTKSATHHWHRVPMMLLKPQNNIDAAMWTD
jgi:hypothetical protein